MFSNTWCAQSLRNRSQFNRCAYACPTFSCAARVSCTHAVELARFLVEGRSLLDGAEAGDAEGLTGLGDGVNPAADVLVPADAGGVGLLGDESAVLVGHQAGFLESAHSLLTASVPDLATASTDATTTSHFELLECASDWYNVFAQLVSKSTESNKECDSRYYPTVLQSDLTVWRYYPVPLRYYLTV